MYIVDNAADHHHQGKDHHHRQGKDLDLKQKQSRSSSQVGSCLLFTVFYRVAWLQTLQGPVINLFFVILLWFKLLSNRSLKVPGHGLNFACISGFLFIIFGCVFLPSLIWGRSSLETTKRGLYDAWFDFHLILLFIEWDLNKTYHFRVLFSDPVVRRVHCPNQTKPIMHYFNVVNLLWCERWHLIGNTPCFYHFLEKKAFKNG